MTRRGYTFWSLPELQRARYLAADVGLPAGSIALMLKAEFDRDRTPDSVRAALRDNFGWRANKPRGVPFKACGAVLPIPTRDGRVSAGSSRRSAA